MKRVFLGGTCNGSNWRNSFISYLDKNILSWFDPVVEDWTEECQAEELRQRVKCDFCLYVITPKMTGVYAIAEVVQDSVRRPEKTLFCVLSEDEGVEFEVSQTKSLLMVAKMIEQNGAMVFGSLDAVADYLNQSYGEIPYNPNLIECLIERDGMTEINLNQFTYRFEKNELGDYVCEVLSGDHRKHLLSLPDFRIYQEDKLPTPEFTAEEDSFMREWKLLSADTFLAYVNGHITTFNSSRAKIRKMAAEKWRALLSHMDCPIRVDDDPLEEVPQGTQEHLPPLERNSPDSASSEDELTAFDRDWWKKWQKLNGMAFKNYVNENEQQFLDAPEFLWDKAVEKWGKLITNKTGEVWPFEGED